MADYAFNEFGTVLSKFPKPIDVLNPNVQYACALVSELAYQHVPEFEIGSRKRAQIVPCDSYQEIVASGQSTDVVRGLRTSGGDINGAFVVTESKIIAIGIPYKNILFIGFRGTRFFSLFDWYVNLRILRRIPYGDCPFGVWGCGSRRYSDALVHRGFSDEACRIFLKIKCEIRERKLKPEHIFLTGHSLGGAVAALVRNHFNRSFYMPGTEDITTCILGAPRYGNMYAYTHISDVSPVSIQRTGDFVPSVPPRILGYDDHPYRFDTEGRKFIVPEVHAGFVRDMIRLGRFLGGRFEPHKVEKYRSELGVTAKATFANAKLVDIGQFGNGAQQPLASIV